MRKDLDITLIRAFLAVVEAGGVTRAAASLGVSQAAASQQIKRLEEALDCRLFEREGRGLVLAPAGERLLAQARRLLALNDEVWAAMRTPSFEGEVRLGVPYDIIGSFVPPILRRFAKAQPRVRVSLVCEDSTVVRAQLRSGGVDLALTTETDCGRHGETLRTDRLVWVGMPGGDAHLRDPLPVSLGAPTCVFRPVAVEALGKARRDWRAVCEVSRLEPVHAAIEAGLAVAPLLRSSVPRALRDLRGQDGARGAPAGAAGIPRQPLCAARPQPGRARSGRPCAGQLLPAAARVTTIDTIQRCLVGATEITIATANGVRMRFLLGWMVRLGVVAVAYLAVTGSVQFKLPDTILGYEVPSQARQWVERNGRLDDLAGTTEAGLRQIADRLR